MLKRNRGKIKSTGFAWREGSISNGISVVQVNPYAVKQIKELEDNSQLKDDSKNPEVG